MRTLIDKAWFYGKKSAETIIYSCLDWAVVSTYWDDTKIWFDPCQWIDD